MHKRTFLKNIALAGLATPLSAGAFGRLTADFPIDNEDFWSAIRRDYILKPDYINLENGYYNILPQSVLLPFLEQVRRVNYEGAYYMRTEQFDNKKKMSARLAAIAGCEADELIITRNTTESLDMIIAGFPWKPGDEAVMAMQDYGSMLDMFKQVAMRHGIVNNMVSLPNHPGSDEEIVSLYEKAISSKTKLLMIAHMVNITGQILPVKKICAMAHSKGVPVMVDGAHAFAHLQFRMDDLDCDYYGASLHKWLSTPLGAGILYVKKGRVGELWPLLAEGGRNEQDILRLNHTGTHPVHTDLAISSAIDNYLKIGAEKKETRLRWLQQYWTTKLRAVPNVIINTPVDPSRSCAIANVGIKGMPPAQMAERLLKQYRIYTVAIDYANVHGCRITPNVFTTPQELDVLVQAVREMAATAG